MNNVTYEFKPHIIDVQKELSENYLKEFDAKNPSFNDPLVHVNPFEICPLTALIQFVTPSPEEVTLIVKGRGGAQDLVRTFPGKKTEHILSVYGLYGDYLNEVVIKLDSGEEKTLYLQTDPLPDFATLPEYCKTTYEYFGDQLMIVSPSSEGNLVGYDYRGEIRWYTTIGLSFGLHDETENGHLYIGTERLLKLPYYVSGIYEFDLTGKIYKEYRIPGGLHHDFCEGKNRELVILTQDFNRDTVEDMCVVVDKDSGVIKRTIDLKPLLPREAAGGNRVSGSDWLHSNSIWFDEKTNSLSISGRNLDAIVNLDYDSGELNWILGDPEKWPVDMVEKYFFTPVDDGSDFEWFYAQHAASILPDGDVLIFDNGAWRNKFTEKDIPAADKYSRGVRYRLDMENKTVAQVYQYGKERGYEFFSPHISNALYYGPGHYLVHSGDIGTIKGTPCEKPPIFYLNKPEEKDLNFYSITTEIIDDDVVYEMKLPAMANYRAIKVGFPLTEGKEFFAPGTRLGDLGESNKMRVGWPKKLAEMNQDFGIQVYDEVDRFVFSVLLDTGTYAGLILKNDDEMHAFPIPTIEMDELAMCIGRFQDSDERRVSVTISKAGLEGKYGMFLYVEGKVYDINLYLDAFQ